MTKQIVAPPSRTCRYCGQGGQILFFKCKRCGRRYMGKRTYGGMH